MANNPKQVEGLSEIVRSYTTTTRLLTAFILTFLALSSYSQTWTGSVSTAWENPANWSTGVIPTTVTNATIPAAPTGGRFPTISTGTQGVYDMIIAAGATVTMTGGILQIDRDWRNSGTFNGTGGTIQYVDNAGSLTNYSTGTNIFNNVTINASINPEWGRQANGAITILGDFTNNNSALALNNANATITFAGSSTQNFYSASSSPVLSNVVVNKASGSLVLTSNLGIIGSWTNKGGILAGGSYIVKFSGSGTIGGSVNTTFPRLEFASLAVFTTGNDNSCTGVTFQASSGNSSLTQSGTTALTVNGDVTINQPSADGVTAWNINAGTAIIAGNVNIGGVDISTLRVAKLVATDGTITIKGNLVYKSAAGVAVTAAVDLSGGDATLNVESSILLTNGSGTLTPGTSSNVYYNGTGSQSIVDASSINYNHLTVDKVSGTATLVNPLIVKGNFLLVQGSFNTGNFNMTFAGNYTHSGGVETIGTSTITYNGTGNQVVSSLNNTRTIYNLVVNKTAGSVTYGANITSLSVNNFTLTGGTITPPATTSVAGNLLLSAGTFNAGNNIDVAGNWTNNGAAFVNGNGLVTFSGLAAQTLGGTAATLFHNLTISNTAAAITVNTNTNVSGNLNMNGAATILSPSATVVFNSAAAAGTLTGSGTVRVSRIAATPDFISQYKFSTITLSTINVDYNGAGAQNINNLGYSNLSISGSGNKTASANISISNTLNIGSGVLDMSTYTLGGTLATITGSGTGILKTANSSVAPIPTGRSWAFTIEYNAAAGGQSVVAGTYTNLTNSNTSGTNTATADITVNGTLTMNTSSVLNLGSYALSGSLQSVAGAGRLKTQNTSSTPVPTGKTWTGTVEYNNTTGGQTIMAGTYTNLTSNISSNINTVAGTISLSGTLSITGNIDLGAFAITNAATLSGSGNIRTRNTSATPLPSGKTWTGSVEYYNPTGGQTIVLGTYTTLIISNTSGTNTVSGAVAVSSSLSIVFGGTLDMGTFTLTGAFTASGSGSLRTANTSGTPIPVDKTWPVTIIYNSSSAQTIVRGTYTNITASGGNRTLSATGIVSIAGTFTTGTGTYTAATSTVTFTGSNQPVPGISYNIVNISGSGTKIFSTGTTTIPTLNIFASSVLQQTGGTINITNTLTLDGTFNQANGTFLTSVNITVKSGAFINQSGGLMHFASAITTTPGDNLIIAAGGTVNQSGGTMYCYDYINSPGTFNQNGSNAIFKLYRDWNPGAGSTFNSTAGTVEFAGNAGSGNFAEGTRQFTNILVNAGVQPQFSNTAGSTIPLSGNFTNNSTAMGNTVNSTFTFNGTGDQTITCGNSTSTFGHVVLNKSSGILYLASNCAIVGNWTNNGGTIAGEAYAIKFRSTSGSIGGTVNTAFTGLTFSSGAIYTMNNSSSCNALSFEASSSSSSLTHATGTALTVNGSVTIHQPTATGVSAWNINAGSALVSGNVTIGGTNTNSDRISKVVVTTGTLTINGNLVYNSPSGTSQIATVDLSGGTATLNLKGSLILNNGSGTLTPGTASTVYYNGTGAQTARGGSSIRYCNLNFDKISGTTTLGSAISATNVTLTRGTVSPGASNYLITVSGNWTNNGGVSSLIPVTFTGSSKTINGTGTTTFGAVTFNSGSSYTMSNTNTAVSLNIAAGDNATSLTQTSSGIFTVNGNVIISQPNATAVNTWNINSGTATVTGNINIGSTNTSSGRVAKVVITTGTLHANGNIVYNSASGNPANAVVDMSGGAGVINLKGSLTLTYTSGTLAPGTTSTVNFNGSAAQSVSFASQIKYNNIHSNNTTGVTISGAVSATNVTGNIKIQSGIFSNGGFAIAGASGKVFEVVNGATFNITGTSGMVTGFGTKTFGATSTVNYGGTTQTVGGENYGHLTISGSATKTLGGSGTVNGTLTLTAGTFALAANTLTINAAISAGSGTLTGGTTSNIIIGGTTVSTTLPAVTLNNLTINRANGIFLGGDVAVSGTLTFTSGIIQTNTNTVIITSTGSVSRTSGHINGNLRKWVVTGATSRTFEVGGAAYYTPVLVTFASVTTAGNLTAKAVAGDHDEITASTVNILKSASRHWFLTNSGIVFTNYSITCTFNSADVDAGANTANFIVGRWASATWTYPTAGTKTATSTQATGITAFGDFMVGEYGLNYVKTWSGGAGTPNWGDANNWSPNGVPTSAEIVDLGGANTINVNVNAIAAEIKLHNTGLVLNINSGNALTVPGNFTMNSGTFNTAASFPAISGSVVLNDGTVGYTALSGNQTIAAWDYTNLVISGGGTKTLAGNITLMGDLTVSGGIFDLGTYTSNRSVVGGTLTVGNGATIKIGGSNTRPFNYANHSIAATSTFDYAGTTQLVKSLNSSQVYGNLVISGSGTKTLEADIAVINLTISADTLETNNFNINCGGNWTNNASFNCGSGTVIFNGTSTLSGSNTTTFNNVFVSGALTAHSTNMNVTGNWTNNGTFTHNSGTITFNSTTTIAGSSTTNFNNLVTSGTVTAPSSTVNVAGNWTNTGTFVHNNGTVNFNGTASQSLPVINFYNITSSSTGARVLPSGTIGVEGTFTPGSNSYTNTGNTIAFISASAQSVPSFTYNQLTLSGAGTTKSASGNVIVNGTLTIADSVTFNMQTFTLSGTLTTDNTTGLLLTQNTSANPLPENTTWVFPVTYNNASAQTIVTGNYSTLDATGGNRTLAAGVVGIELSFIPGAGTYTVTGNTVDFNGHDNQNIPAFTFNNLTANGIGTTKTATGNVVVNGALTINSGINLDLSTFTLAGTLASVTGTGILETENISATPLPAGKTWTVEVDYYSSATQTIVTGNYKTLDGSGGNRTLSPGTTGIAGSFIPGAGTYTVTGSTIAFNGSARQTIPGFTFNHLTINKSSGDATLGGDITVNGNLTFTVGKITTGVYKVAIASSGSVAGASQSTGWVVGKLEKNFALGLNVARTYEVGDATNYSPATGTIASVTTAGNIAVTTTATDHTLLSSSAIPVAKSVNRFWTFENAGVTFTNATVTFNWASGDVDTSTNTGLFGAEMYNGAWTTVSTSNRTSLSIQATGVTAFGDFAVGQTLTGGNWVGSISGNWNDAQNWQYQVLPEATMDVAIGSASTNFPVLSSGTAAVRNLSLESGAALTVTNATLQVSGTLNINGIFTATNGNLSLATAAAQTIPAGMFVDNTVKNLVINTSAGVTLAGPLKVTGILSFGNVNNSVLNTGGFLTLASTSTGTASVADITNGGANSGNTIDGLVTVERYTIARRAYRFLSSAVNTTGSIRENWMENTNNLTTSDNINPVPGYGTHITGSAGNTNGFDATNTNNPSLFTFNTATQAWVAVTSTSETLMAGVPYRLFVRGSRSTDLNTNSAVATPTTLRATGTLTTGTVVFSYPGGGGSSGMPETSTTLNGYSFIANPYASPVSWSALTKNDLYTTINVFDPTISGSRGRGGYVSYNSTTNSNSNPSSNIDNNIQSGQAFFVQTSGSNPSVTFKEIDKTGINRFVYRNSSTLPNLKVQLLLPGQEVTGEAADGLTVFFSDDFSTTIGNEDSYKFTNQDENIAIFRNGTNLSIEGRKTIESTDTIPLSMWQLTQKKYSLKISTTNFPSNMGIYLEDSFLVSSRKLDRDSFSIIPFDITADAKSVNPKRFKIVFKTTATTLPVQMTAVKAYEKNKGVEVQWIAENESNLKNYEIERSSDGIHFVTLAAVPPTPNRELSKEYSWFDGNPSSNTNFYRIKSVDKSGEIKWSKVVTVKLEIADATISVSAGAASGNEIKVFFKNANEGTYAVSITNSAGQVVYEGSIGHAGGSSTRELKLNQVIAAGIYQLRFIRGDQMKTIPVLLP